MAVLASDHLIKDKGEFLNVLSVAKRVAEEEGYLITLGIRPERPETGYGYIQYGEVIVTINNKRIFKVERFIEKPKKEMAEEFLSSENYLWNSGIFIWKVDTILKMIEIHIPELWQGLMRIDNVISTRRGKDASPTDKERDIIGEVYSSIKGISIDYGIMEKAKGVVVIPCDLGWNDVGCWNSLIDVLPYNEDGNVVIGKHIGIDTTGSIIHNTPYKLIATIGIKDMIIIETEDAILICPRERGEDVKRLVEVIKEKGMNEYL
jgi:mannose-1-phosphate guanylyltransferase